MAVDHRPAQRVPRPVRQRSRRHRRGGRRRRRPPAGALPGLGRRPGHPRRAGRSHRHPRRATSRSGCRAQAAGGYVEYDAGDGRVLPHRGAGVRAHRPRGPALRARGVRAGARHAAGRAADHRRVPHRRRDGLARAARRRPGRLRDVLPTRLRSPTSCRAGSRPSTGSTEQALCGRAGRRCRLRPRCLDGAARAGLPALAVRGLGLPRRLDRARPQARRGGGRGGPHRHSRSRRRRVSPALATIWSPRSTACTTWVTRQAPPGTCARRSPLTGPG